MAKQVRCKTSYPGVYYVDSFVPGTNKPDRIYNIRYRRGGKMVEERVGRQSADDMTPARASTRRTERIEGKQLSNVEMRKKSIVAKKNEQEKWTIQKLHDEYFLHRVDNKSARTEKGLYKNYLKASVQNLEPHELLKLNLDRLRIKLLKSKSPQTVKLTFSLLKRLINFGVDRALCLPPPFKITLPAVDNIKTEDLTPAQLQNLFTVMAETEFITAANMMKLALFTGMRRGELFKLKWGDIDSERGFINIIAPKGGKSQKIPLTDSAREIFNSVTQTGEYVFPARNGGPRKDISKDLRAIKEKAGLPKDFRPLHGLRHVYATMLASSGEVDMFSLQKLLTHKDQRMTQRYVHYRDDALKKAGNLAGDIINAALRPSKKVVNIKN